MKKRSNINGKAKIDRPEIDRRKLTGRLFPEELQKLTATFFPAMNTTEATDTSPASKTSKGSQKIRMQKTDRRTFSPARLTGRFLKIDRPDLSVAEAPMWMGSGSGSGVLNTLIIGSKVMWMGSGAASNVLRVLKMSKTFSEATLGSGSSVLRVRKVVKSMWMALGSKSNVLNTSKLQKILWDAGSGAPSCVLHVLKQVKTFLNAMTAVLGRGSSNLNGQKLSEAIPSSRSNNLSNQKEVILETCEATEASGTSVIHMVHRIYYRLVKRMEAMLSHDVSQASVVSIFTTMEAMFMADVESMSLIPITSKEGGKR